MSSGYEVFIKNNNMVNIEDINKILRTICYKNADEEFDDAFGEHYWYQIMGTEFTLVHAVDFEDDRDLELSKYDFLISTKKYSAYYNNPEYDVFCASMVSFIGAELASVLKTKVLVVRDLQSEVAKFDYSS